MFENIGKKIKGLCKIVFYVLAIGCIIGGFVVFINTVTADNVEFEQVLLGLLLLVVIGGGGTLIAWLLVLFFYGFGEIIDANLKQVKQNKVIISILSNGKITDEENDNADSSVKHFVLGSVRPINFESNNEGVNE